MNDKAQPSEWNDKKECPYCTKTMNWGLLYHLSAFVRNQVGPLSLTFSTIQYISMELKGIYSQYNPPPHPQQTPLNIDLTDKQNGNISCTLTVSTIFKTIKPPFIHCQIHHIRDTCPPPPAQIFEIPRGCTAPMYVLWSVKIKCITRSELRDIISAKRWYLVWCNYVLMEEWNTMVESAAYLRCNQLFRIFNSVKIWQENMFIKFLEGKNLTTSAGYESKTHHSQTYTLYKER